MNRWDQERHRALNKRQRLNYFAYTGDSGTAAMKTKSHVCTNSRSTFQVRISSPPQHRSSVGGPAAESSSCRDLFVKSDLCAATAQFKRSSHQIFLFASQPLSTMGADDLKRVTITQLDRVAEIKAHHFRVDQVIPVITNSRDAQRHR